MIIITKVDLEYTPAPSIVIQIPACSQLTPINSYYLVNEAWVASVSGGVQKYIPAGLADTFFFVYMKGFYLAIPKEVCEIPVSIGWKFNI